MIYNCKIRKGAVFLNGTKQSLGQSDTENWTKELYLELGLNYPKFYKMDDMSKMAMLAFTMLKDTVDFDQYGENDLSLIFANSGSSIETDKKFISSYSEKGSPSPSLFVYTLPNILTGELAILNKWFGENIFLINEKYSPELYLEQINFYFSKGAKACLCGWVENKNKEQDCTMFLVTNDGTKTTEKELLDIYNQ